MFMHACLLHSKTKMKEGGHADLPVPLTFDRDIFSHLINRASPESRRPRLLLSKALGLKSVAEDLVRAVLVSGIETFVLDQPNDHKME